MCCWRQTIALLVGGLPRGHAKLRVSAGMGDGCVPGAEHGPEAEQQGGEDAPRALPPRLPSAGWLEAHTLSWAEMLPLLQHAGEVEVGQAGGRGLEGVGRLYGPAGSPQSTLTALPNCLQCGGTLPACLVLGGEGLLQLLAPLVCLPTCLLRHASQLPAARRRPWEERSNLLFFRGAATGHRNLSALSSVRRTQTCWTFKCVGWCVGGVGGGRSVCLLACAHLWRQFASHPCDSPLG